MKALTNDNKEYIEVISTSSLYDDINGKQKLIKANILTRLSLYTEDIQAHEEVFDNYGKHQKKLCKIYHKSIGAIIIKETYDNISKLKEALTTRNKAGFHK